MKFTLTYEGALPPSANKSRPREVWAIRQAFHPQLDDLWKSHPALQSVLVDERYFPKHGGATLRQTHHQHPGPILHHPDAGHSPEILDLCESINKHGAWFRPLVRETFALHCGVKILFLRKEPPGRIYQGGDIDGRIKALLDALTIPQHEGQVVEKPAPGQPGSREINPICCLLEDDSFVSGLQVESERLLTDQSQAANYAKLTIEVDVRVRVARIYNQSFV